MLRRVLYLRTVNTALRSLLHPMKAMLPERMRFPIVEPFDLDIGGGRSIRIIANETSYVSKILFWEGIRGYEYHMVPAYMDLARTADVVIDVGANIGYYALLAAAVNPDVTVAAFEPSPAAFTYLERNLLENGFENVRAERLAVSDRTGTVTFIEARNPKFPRVVHHLTGASGIGDPGEGYVHNRPFEVDTVTLDTYVEAHLKGRIDIMKIDAEASEHLVLRGAVRTVRRDRPVIFCEALPDRVEEEMQTLFDSYGYALFNARPDGFHRVPRLRGPNLISHDFVAVPEERADAFEARFMR